MILLDHNGEDAGRKTQFEKEQKQERPGLPCARFKIITPRARALMMANPARLGSCPGPPNP